MTSPGGVRRALRPDSTWIPFIGAWLTSLDMDGSLPFGETGAWAPVTAVAIRCP